GQITIYGRAVLTVSDEQLQLCLTKDPGGAAGPIDYTAVETAIRPPGVSNGAWTPLFQHIKQQLGTTWADYHRAIANDATLLPPGLGYNDSLADVFQLEIDNATAALNTSVSGHVYLRDTAHPLSNVPIELLDPATPQTYSTVSL